MGTLHKIIDKIFFCMDRNSRIGLFLSIEVTITLIGLVSLVSNIMLLIKIGFPLHGVILLLLSVRIGISFMIFNLKSIQYFGVTIFFLQTRGAKVFGAETGPKKWAMNLGLLMVAPMVQLLILLGFSHSWKIGNTKREV